MEIYSYEPSIRLKLKASTEYQYELVDQETGVSIADSFTTDLSGYGVVPFPDSTSTKKYDAWYSLSVYEGTVSPANLVFMDTISKVRPYVKSADAVTYMAGKITDAQAVEYERIARHWINSILGFGFEFLHKEINAVGNGTDFLPLHDRVVQVYKVYENNELIFDSTTPEAYDYSLNVFEDRSVVKSIDDEHNRLEYKMVWQNRYADATFRLNYDYRLEVDAGWPVVPQDIQDATLLLINEIACGNNRYSGKYMRSVDNGGGQRIQYFDQVIAGTGNVIVDNILSRYIPYSIRVRVL